MHVKASSDYAIHGFLYDKVIGKFGTLTLLFMIVSAFSMCCGYYEKMKRGLVTPEKFYVRRFKRILPYFAILCTLEAIYSHTLASVYEWFADLTLAFGLLPNPSIDVVGVGWFLGVIFVFYIAFPYYTFLIGTKKRAWLVLVVAIIMNFLCQVYFFDSNHVLEGFRARGNIVYSFMFLVAGGLIYLYRERLRSVPGLCYWLTAAVLVASAVFYLCVNDTVFALLIIFSALVCLAISSHGPVSKVLMQNRVAVFLSKISMEVYLCQMFIFNAVKRLGLTKLTGNDIVNYAIACLLTIAGAIVYAWVVKNGIDFIEKRIEKKKVGA